MSRKQVFTVVVSLMVSVVSLAMPSPGEANTGYCDPVRVCVGSCLEVSDIVMTCKEYADHACIFTGGECWDSGDSGPCNSAGYSELICYYSH